MEVVTNSYSGVFIALLFKLFCKKSALFQYYAHQYHLFMIKGSCNQNPLIYAAKFILLIFIVSAAEKPGAAPGISFLFIDSLFCFQFAKKSACSFHYIFTAIISALIITVIRLQKLVMPVTGRRTHGPFFFTKRHPISGMSF